MALAMCVRLHHKAFCFAHGTDECTPRDLIDIQSAAVLDRCTAKLRKTSCVILWRGPNWTNVRKLHECKLNKWP